MTETCTVCRSLRVEQRNFVRDEADLPIGERHYVDHISLAQRIAHYSYRARRENKGEMPTLAEFYSNVELLAIGMGWKGDVLPVLRKPKHHGTGCHYGVCVDHCKCPKERQQQWRAEVRNAPALNPHTSSQHVLQAKLRFVCNGCAESSTHSCLQFSENDDMLNIPITQRFCARCCRRGACQYATALIPPCTNTDSLTTIRECTQCRVMRSEQVFGQDSSGCMHYICMFCTESSCRTCFHFVRDSLCEDCGCCARSGGQSRACCRCQALLRPTMHNPGVEFTFATPSKSIRHPSSRPLGVEIEVNGFLKPTKNDLADLYNLCVTWGAGIGTDGSCGDTGTEIRTAPACNGYFVNQIRTIVRAMKKANAVIDNRCGLHVHVDARTIMHTQFNSELQYQGYYTPLDTICRMWTQVEPTFYAMVDAKRESGSYCRTWPDTLTRSSNPSAVSLSDVVGGGRSWFNVWQTRLTRYTGLNLHAYSSHKTLEFRLHHATLNSYHIIAWAQLCAAFVDACVFEHDPMGLLQRVRDDGDRGLKWLQSIAPSPRAKCYIGYQQRKKARLQGEQCVLAYRTIPEQGVPACRTIPEQLNQVSERVSSPPNRCSPGSIWVGGGDIIGEQMAHDALRTLDRHIFEHGVAGTTATTIVSDEEVDF